MNHHDVIAVRYAELADAAGADGVKRTEATAAIAAELEALTAAGDLALSIDYEALVRSELAAIDNLDRKQQADRLQIARDALDNQTILGPNDPMLDAVCAVGGGVRKTYRYLDVDDLLAIIERKQRHAADATAAAQRVTALVMDLLRAMRGQAVDSLGELFA
jgi:hypothetical protein